MTDHALTPLAAGIDEVDKAHRRDRRRQKLTTVFRYVLLTFVGLIMLYPLIWLIGASFKTNSEIFANPGFLPDDPTIDAGLVELDLSITKRLTSTGVVSPGSTVTFELVDRKSVV